MLASGLTDADQIILGSSVSSRLLSTARISWTALDTLGGLCRKVWDRSDPQDVALRPYEANNSEGGELASMLRIRPVGRCYSRRTLRIGADGHLPLCAKLVSGSSILQRRTPTDAACPPSQAFSRVATKSFGSRRAEWEANRKWRSRPDQKEEGTFSRRRAGKWRKKCCSPALCLSCVAS